MTVFTPTVSAANSLDALRGLVPPGAERFDIDLNAVSTNGHSWPASLYWWYDGETKQGFAYLLIRSDNGKPVDVNDVRLGGKQQTVTDFFQNSTDRYTLLRFDDIWLTAETGIYVPVDGANGGHTVKQGTVLGDFFPEMLNIVYWDGNTWLGSDTTLKGRNLLVWDISYLPDIPDGYEFLGWDTNPVARSVEWKSNDQITLEQNYDLYAVWGKDLSQTRNVVYTVKYTQDDTEVIADTYKVTIPVWINEPADFAVPVEAISAANNRYTGYKLVTNPFVAPATAQNGDTITVPYTKIPYTVTFKPGTHADFDPAYPLVHIAYYGDDATSLAPYPYAEFGWKFMGWKDTATGKTYAPTDYMHPNTFTLPSVTGDATYEAQWALVNPKQTFPDRIPSETHFDQWWEEYGVLCVSSSTTKDGNYEVYFADWFFDVYQSCKIAFGSNTNKFDYEIVFTKDSAIAYEYKNGKPVQSEKIEMPKPDQYSVIRDGKYYTKAKAFDYGKDDNASGKLLGYKFDNPFGSGAKLAWLC
ncbi:MAG: InlB B-repeat-containing protein [Nitrososphaerota archaeon]|nr:InlB B-repeat-containing protein [Nitrososphaerota archaeon]